MAQNPPLFTNNELRQLMINPMGRTSEVKNLPAFQLAYAEAGNSGFSIGPLQFDYGAHTDFEKSITGDVENLIDAYNRWARDNNTTTIDNRDEAIFLIAQNRDHIKDHNLANPNDQRTFVDIRTTELGRNINSFLSSNDGHAYVYQLQADAFNAVQNNLTAVMGKTSFQSMTHDEQVKVLAVVGKISNQAGTQNNYTNKMIALLDRDDITYAQFETSARQITSAQGYLLSGFNNTLEGAEIYNRLYNLPEGNILGDAFKRQLETNPFDLNKDRFNDSPEAQLLDTLFRNPTQVEDVITALSNNGNAQIRPDVFSNDPSKTQALADEMSSVLIKDGTLVVINHDGSNAHRFTNNEWLAFDNALNPVVHRDHRNGYWTSAPQDIALNNTGPRVLELQNKLTALGLASNLTINIAQPTFDTATQEVIQTRQRDNSLPVTGRQDTATRNLLDRQLNELNIDHPSIRDVEGLQHRQDPLASIATPANNTDLASLSFDELLNRLLATDYASNPAEFMAINTAMAQTPEAQASFSEVLNDIAKATQEVESPANTLKLSV